MVLQFQRQPFKTKTASVIVPWNQIVTMDTVSMVLEGSDDVEEQGLQCAVQQDPHSLKPLVLSTWQHTQLGSCPSESAIIPESQVKHWIAVAMVTATAVAKSLVKIEIEMLCYF